LHKEIDIVGIGVATLDILSIVDHFPVNEEVQKAYESAIDGGGPVATALAAASKLGAKTIMLDNLGNDWIGIDIREGLHKAGVDTSYIQVHQDCNSSIAQILVRKGDAARTIIYTPGNLFEFTWSNIQDELIRKAKYVHINGRHMGASLKACETAKFSGTKISFDGGAHRYRKELMQVIPLVDLLIASKHFAFEYTGKTNNEEAAKDLLNLGIETVVITDGIQGNWLYTKDIFAYHQPAYINKINVDTTGCGDSYHGAFLYSLCNGRDYKEAMMIASAVASINAKALGGRKALPHLKEVEEFLATK
jgi:sulfofructose kinase